MASSNKAKETQGTLCVCVCVCVCEKQNVFHAFVDFTDNRTGSTNQTTEKFIKGKL